MSEVEPSAWDAAIAVQHSAHDGFIDVDITIPDFQIIAALRIGANPGLVMNIGSLAAKIR